MKKARGQQSSIDAMTVLREQTLTHSAAAFFRQCLPHDTAARSLSYNVDNERQAQRV